MGTVLTILGIAALCVIVIAVSAVLIWSAAFDNE